MMRPTPDHQLAARIKQQARELGFDLVGIAPAGPSAYREYLRQWLHEGQHGTMQWLANRFDERTDPGVYLPGAASVVCVATSYHQPDPEQPIDEAAIPGRIARYARGDDYHDLLKKRLHQLADGIKQLAPEAQTRACVDTAPVMEKELAQRAGLGWVGKNTLLIHPRIGSWTLLGEVITTLLLPPTNRGSTAAAPAAAVLMPVRPAP
jgi:epoxyqueuosine reductase